MCNEEALQSDGGWNQGILGDLAGLTAVGVAQLKAYWTMSTRHDPAESRPRGNKSVVFFQEHADGEDGVGRSYGIWLVPIVITTLLHKTLCR
jgi:hypothetical protein